MIAIHSALYIFKPRVAQGEGGLYPYRNIAYIIWLVVPLILASLAFINNDNAYITEGTYCYLPVRPFWYRLALTWIPRYLIFIVILGIYVSIYYYVRYKFHGFTKVGRTQSDGTDDNSGEHADKPSKHPKRQGIPPTPTLACHGLISDSRKPSDTPETQQREHSTPAMENIRTPPISSPASVHRFMWANLIASDDHTQSQTPSSEISTVDADSFIGSPTPRPLPQLRTTFPISPREGSFESTDPSAPRDTSWRDGFVTRLSLRPDSSGTSKRSVVDIFTVLRHRPGETEAPTPVSQLQLVNSNGQNLAVSEMLKTREKIRRQLRFLFIYPLVYTGMWIIPFVSHVMQYDDKYALNPPFGLTCVTTVCICSQAAVDCWLFSTREKPWRHIPGTNGGFFSSLKFWTGWKGFLKRRVKAGPGKSREEMVREAKAAYRRRDQEMAQRRNEAGQAGPERDPGRVGRSWWESTGLNGPAEEITPAVEISNPVEDILVQDRSAPDGETPVRQERVHFDVPEEETIEGDGHIKKTTSTEVHSSSSSST
jgi:G protein-coupled receptor GPR1